VKQGDMPLWFYLPMHAKARLSDADVAAICTWSAAETSRLTSKSR